jgi:uncharacterized membrane protein YcaP (DUF421 family)
MKDFFFSDWHSVARILVVAPLLYAVLILMLRKLGKHSLAKSNAYGLIVTVAIGSAIASAILTKNVSLLDGFLCMALLLGLEYTLATISSRSRKGQDVLQQQPTLLLYNGRILREALRDQRVTEAEILAAVRQGGMATVETVGAVVLESDGSFSVIPQLEGSCSALSDVERIAADPTGRRAAPTNTSQAPLHVSERLSRSSLRFIPASSRESGSLPARWVRNSCSGIWPPPPLPRESGS